MCAYTLHTRWSIRNTFEMTDFTKKKISTTVLEFVNVFLTIQLYRNYDQAGRWNFLQNYKDQFKKNISENWQIFRKSGTCTARCIWVFMRNNFSCLLVLLIKTEYSHSMSSIKKLQQSLLVSIIVKKLKAGNRSLKKNFKLQKKNTLLEQQAQYRNHYHKTLQLFQMQVSIETDLIL